MGKIAIFILVLLLLGWYFHYVGSIAPQCLFAQDPITCIEVVRSK